MHELRRRGAHAEVLGDLVGAGELVVAVVDRVAPVLGGLAAQQRDEGVAVDVRRRRRAGDVQEGRGVVDVLDECVDGRAGLDDAGPAHDQRHHQRLLVHPALVVPAVVAEVEALVGAVDDDGVVGEALLLEPVHEPADALVDAADAAQVVLQVALVHPADEVLALEIGRVEGGVAGAEGLVPARALRLGHAREVPVARRVEGAAALGYGAVLGRHEEVVEQLHVALDRHLRGERARGIVQVVVEEGRRHGQVLVGPQIEVTARGHPGAVRRLVLAHEHPGAVLLVLVLEPAEGEVGDDVGAVPLDRASAVLVDQHRVVVVPLAGEHVPVVEALGVRVEVPLADHRGPVAGAAELLGEGPLVPVELVAVAAEAVRVAVLAGEDGGAARAADGVAAERAREDDALGGQPVDARRGVDAVHPGSVGEMGPVGADGVGRVIVAEDEEDVGSSWLRRALLTGRRVGRCGVAASGGEGGDEGDGENGKDG